MKTKWIGAGILAVVLLVGIGVFVFQNRTQITTLDGYLGGEKIGVFEDAEIQDILQKEYHIAFSYSRAGSLDMVTADADGKNYLFPSSQTALEYYQDCNGNPDASEIIFNTPIVLYSHQPVVDALVQEGIVTQKDDIYYADMEKLTELILNGTSWSEIGLSELYGSVSVDTTDPSRSNSGNMFAALLANVLNGGKPVQEAELDAILPELQEIFSRLGYMETSSSQLFEQFLKMGMGAKPIIAGYENQLLEYAEENPEDYDKIKDDIVILYPSPTVWSSHVYIALDDAGKAGIDALCDEQVQALAWKKHGFRTGSNGAVDLSQVPVSGIPQQIPSVMHMPAYAVMKRIIDTL